MDKMDYWGRIDRNTKFDLDFERPEQKRLAGSLLIMGGHANSFFSVAKATQVATESGFGEVATVLPDSLEKKLPKTEHIRYLKSEKSGGFAKADSEELIGLMKGKDMCLAVGDMGKNAEVVSLMSDILKEEASLMVTRDAVDLAIASDGIEDFLERDSSYVFLSIAQLKKLLQEIYYPRVLNLTMPLLQVVEILHKLTLSYEATFVTMHSEQILLAQGGKVLTVALGDTKYNPLSLYDGELATQMLRLLIWNKEKNQKLELMAAACLEM